jgi:lipopolysaccharide transport system ATP-binding protein
MKPALRAENLSKSYRLGLRSAGQYQTLRENLARAIMRPWRRLRRNVARPSSNGRLTAVSGESQIDSGTLWALKDVSFEVQPGEVVGIIGRNGAGKSTLLKILSRVTEPTRGRAALRGRIGSLLEVGTGFHPELTGRENVFLSGAILGMSRREIIRKFDEIVAFAEIEQFLDTPVKRYSSGMYVRLAFAVAAHLEPEILVVDEVLAVGDAEFQKKCLRKMQDASLQGKTVLYVSHNLPALQALCRRGMVLERGRLIRDASIAEAATYYLSGLRTAVTVEVSERTDRYGAGGVRLQEVGISSDTMGNSNQILMGRPAQFTFRLNRSLPGINCIVSVYDEHGHESVRLNSGLGSMDDACHPSPEPALTCTLDEMLLAPGQYRIEVALLAGGELQDCVDTAAWFEVIRGPVRGREPPLEAGWRFCIPHRWQNSA